MALGNSNVQTESIATIRIKDPKLIGEAWNLRVMHSRVSENVLSRWEGGEGSGKPFTVKNDLKGDVGDRVNFLTMGSLNQPGRRGSEELEGYEEHVDESTFNCTIDQIRGGVGYTQLRTYITATGSTYETTAAKLVGEWMGRKDQNDMLMTLIKGAIGSNTVRPNRRSTANGLYSADTMSTVVISEAASMAKNRGAKPARLGKSMSGEPIARFTIFAPDNVLNPLNSYDTYLQAARYSQERGSGNTQFAGGYTEWLGHAIHHWETADGTYAGPLATPLNPKAKLGDLTRSSAPSTGLVSGGNVTMSAAGGANGVTYSIRGNGRTISAMGDYATFYLPFEWFPGYPYKTAFEQVVANETAATIYYAVIYDPADGKWLPFTYDGYTAALQGNNGYELRIKHILGAAATAFTADTSSNDATTVAGIAYAAHNTAGKFKTSFSVGSWIIPVNEKCVPYGYGFMLGETSAVKAYGKMPVQRISNDRDYKEKRGIGIKSLRGQAVALDVDGQPHNYVMFTTAVEHQGIYLPTISGTVAVPVVTY